MRHRITPERAAERTLALLWDGSIPVPIGDIMRGCGAILRWDWFLAPDVRVEGYGGDSCPTITISDIHDIGTESRWYAAMGLGAVIWQRLHQPNRAYRHRLDWWTRHGRRWRFARRYAMALLLPTTLVRDTSVPNPGCISSRWLVPETVARKRLLRMGRTDAWGVLKGAGRASAHGQPHGA